MHSMRTLTCVQRLSSKEYLVLELGAKKWPYRAPTYALAVSHPGNDHDDSSHLPADSEQLLCFCQQPESGEMIMIACDHVQ